MIKRNYRSSETEVEPQGPKADLVDKETATETGGRGLNLMEMTSEYDSTDPNSYDDKSEHIGEEQPVSSQVFDLLVLLGDGLDQNGEEHLANFADFLIQKFADAEKVDHAILFNKLMIKINNADLVNTNEIIKKLTKIYSRTLLLEYYKNQDLEASKKSAYKKTLHRADQYLSEG